LGAGEHGRVGGVLPVVVDLHVPQVGRPIGTLHAGVLPSTG
jgi:hypothetical protein